MESFEDLSSFINDIDTNQQSEFDSCSQNSLTGFPNEFGFQPDSSFDPIVSMGFDNNQFLEIKNQDDDFLNHEMTTHEILPDFSQNHDLSNERFSHGDMNMDNISFGATYNDAEIEKMKDNVEHYQYVVDTLNSKVHHLEDVVDLAKRNNSFNVECKEDQLNDAISEYNNAISRLNDAKAKLNNAI